MIADHEDSVRQLVIVVYYLLRDRSGRVYNSGEVCFFVVVVVCLVEDKIPVHLLWVC